MVETADYFLLLKVLKTLADNIEEKIEIYLRATHNDISNINLQYYQRVSKRDLRLAF